MVRYLLVSLGLLASLAGCGTTPPQSAMAPLPSGGEAFDIPRLDHLVIDGNADDWGSAGFKIDSLAEMSGSVPAASRFDARARLAWDDRGLLILADCYTDLPSESENDAQLWLGDSLELFLAPSVGAKDEVQAVIAPGWSADHPALRTEMEDVRNTRGFKGCKPSVIAARTLSNGHCLVEALLPWDQLGITPTPGTQVAFQLIVNHAHGGGTPARMVWFPAVDTHANTASMCRLRLASSAGVPVELAAAGTYERFRRVRVGINASERFAGKTVTVSDGDHLLGTGTLQGAGPHSYVNLVLPMPPPKSTYGPLTVSVGGGAAVTVALPDARPLRLSAYREVPLRFSAAVFDSKVFPSGDFEQPSLVEDLIGPYTIRTDYYDADFQPAKFPTRVGRYGAVTTVTADGFVDHLFTTLYHCGGGLPHWGEQATGGSIDFPAALGIDPEVAGQQHAWVSEYLGRLQSTAGYRGPGEAAVLLAGLHETGPGAGPLPHHLDASSLDDRWWYLLRQKIGLLQPYPCTVTLPPGYGDDPNRRWPLLVFLHGSNGHSSDFARARQAGSLRRGEGDPKALPFVIVAPQGSAGAWWDPWMVNDLIDTAIGKYRIDPDRVYLTGLSMGGFGTYETAIRWPDRFAAVAPIAGGASADDAPVLRELPIWAFHGAKDPTVPIGLDLRIVNALQRQGGRVKMSIDPEAGHDSWTNAYGDPQLYDWMLAQTRGHPAQPRATTAPVAAER